MFGTAGAGFERVNLACPKHLLERALGPDGRRAGRPLTR